MKRTHRIIRLRHELSYQKFYKFAVLHRSCTHNLYGNIKMDLHEQIKIQKKVKGIVTNRK
jgi:hypothetical protein